MRRCSCGPSERVDRAQDLRLSLSLSLSLSAGLQHFSVKFFRRQLKQQQQQQKRQQQKQHPAPKAFLFRLRAPAANAPAKEPRSNGTLLAYTQPTNIRELRRQAAMATLSWQENQGPPPSDSATANTAGESSKPAMPNLLRTLTIESENANIIIRKIQPHLLVLCS